MARSIQERRELKQWGASVWPSSCATASHLTSAKPYHNPPHVRRWSKFPAIPADAA